MSDLLRLRPAATADMIAVFDDAATIAHGCAFETALARAQAAQGVIAPELADAIMAGVDPAQIDKAELAEEAALAGTLAIPLVARLRAMVGGAAAMALHHGATSQDVADTVLMVQVRAAHRLLAKDGQRVRDALARSARAHAERPAIGRTLLQDAMPVAFGLRLAQAARGIDDALAMLDAAVGTHAVVQLGGAAGTRAGLDGKGAEIAAQVADALGLGRAAPWHARGTGVAAIGAALGILIGALGKLARDVALLAQNGIGEAREPLVAGRGGSSAMAHKRNPTGCQVALSAAIRAPGLVASLLAGLPQEAERGLGGWQAEGPVLTDLFLLASGSAAALAVVAEGLEIDEAAIARNLVTAAVGDDIGESAAIIADLLADGKD
ncbi:3-carboxy-cis,cis-muconate cycloisomerase [Sphingomonas sp. Leaf407]|uniref:lyase family protein n=1 Tax=unclassified Sphingomonas TaxID=196159 RepID=UPI0006F736BD|nr:MULTISPECIES: lyase family protein [unclassified Sphingomonas]KQN36825.1 3-carboxy-cis,cis-muconate cycloisomerase [Sphingomonas sp. Leaf42]KQT30252.1 3-carboxy-cis,cis-muconate cycloisomerase [Sphingomonas sp. Leaf407]